MTEDVFCNLATISNKRSANEVGAKGASDGHIIILCILKAAKQRQCKIMYMFCSV